MKKAHRRVLMKKIGIMRLAARRGVSASARSARRAGGVADDDGADDAVAPSPSSAEDARDCADSATDDPAARWTSPFSESATASTSPAEEGGRLGGDADDFVADDLAARYSSLDKNADFTDAAGTRDKELRRLRDLKELLLSKTAPTPAAALSEDDYDFVMDDLTARYSSLGNAEHTDAGTRDKELRRLRDSKELLLSKTAATPAAALTEDDYDFVVDDLAARYSSLDNAETDAGTRDKELRRLRDLKELLLSKTTATPAAALSEDDYDFVMDDMAARYSSLDNDAMDGGTKEKQLRRLRELRGTFQRRLERDRYRRREEGDDAPVSSSDDFTSKWHDATRGNSVAANVVGADAISTNQEARRLREIKKRVPQVARRESRVDDVSGATDEGDEEPLRLDLLKKRTTGQDANDIERKERMRIMGLQRLVADRISAERRAARDQHLQRQSMEVDENGKYRSMNDPVGGSVGYLGGDGGGGGVGGGVNSRGKNMYKTNEERRLEDLERYLPSRRSTRQSSTAPSSRPNRKDGGDDYKADTLKNEGAIDDATINLDYDESYSDITVNNVREREAYRSLSTTMPPTNRGVRFVRDKDGRDAAELCDLERDEECWDITRKPNFYAREAQSSATRSLSTTMPPTNRGVRVVRDEDGQDDAELCDLERDEECWDITRKPNFYAREAQSSATRSLSTTMPPTNRGVRVVRDEDGQDDAELCDLERDEECWDITRKPNFYAREAQSFAIRSLSTTMLPDRGVRFVRDKNDEYSAESIDLEEDEELREIARMYENFSRVDRRFMAGQDEGGDDISYAKNDMAGGGAKDANSFPFVESLSLEEVRDLSQSLTEVGGEGPTSPSAVDEQHPQKHKQEEIADNRSAGRAQDLEETAKSLEEVPVSATSISNPPSDQENGGSKTKANRASALYQRLQSEEQAFREISESMNTRANMRRKYSIGSTTPTYSGGDSLPLDIPSRFPAARPSMSVNSGRRSRGAAVTKSFGVTDMTRSQSETPHDKRKDDDTYYNVISQFPRERPSSLVNTGTRKEWTTSGSYDSDINGKKRSMGRNGAKDDAMVSTPSEAADWSTHNFLDKPRPFQSNIDILTSNTSGIRFKRSSDLRHEEKNANFDRWTDMPDINALRGWRQSNEALDRMAMTKLSKTISPSPELEVQSAHRSSNDERDRYSGGEKVMHWLLTHLPDIQEEDAVEYFNCLLEDGFDSIDLGEILDEDLYFMKRGHRSALLQSLIKELYSEVYES